MVFPDPPVALCVSVYVVVVTLSVTVTVTVTVNVLLVRPYHPIILDSVVLDFRT